MATMRETGPIYCEYDTHTTNIYSNKVNHNEISNACGKHSDGYQAYAFFSFKEHGIPNNARIVSAEFHGYVHERLLAGNYTQTIRPCADKWDESLTYSKMPVSSGIASQITLGNAGSDFTADITNIAQAWFSGEYDYANGFYITSSEAKSYKRIYASEFENENYRPYIKFTYYVPASKPTLDVSEITIVTGAVINITANRLSDEYTHKLTWSLAGKTGTIAENVGNTYRWELVDDDVAAIYSGLPNETSGEMKIICETSDATGLPLGTESVSLVIAVPESVKPSVSGVSMTGINLGKDVYYLSGISRMQVEVEANPGNGSEISSIVVTVDGKKYPYASAPIITDLLTGSGKVDVTVVVTDTRGRTVNAGYSSTTPVYAYAPPKVTAFVIERCSKDGATAQIDGENLRITLEASSSLIAMPSVNPVTAQVYTKLRNESSWVKAEEYGGDSHILSLSPENTVLPEIYSPLSSYDIRLVLFDGMGSESEWQTQISTQNVLMNFDPNNMRIKFGGIAESDDSANAVTFGMDAYFKKGMYMPGGKNVPDAIKELYGLKYSNVISVTEDTEEYGGIAFVQVNAPLVQSGTGDASTSNVRDIKTYDSVTVTAMGKNLMGAWELGSISSSTGANSDATTTIRSGYVPVTPGTTYAISRTVAGGSFAVRGYDADKNFLGTGDVCITLVRGATTTNPIGANDYTAVFTVNAGVHYLRFLNYNTSDLTSLFQMEVGTENTEYESYRAQELTCDFDTLVCEADVDFASGKWTQEWQYLELDGTENWQGCKAPSGNWMAWLKPNLPAMFTPTAEIGNAICNTLPSIPATDMPNVTTGGITTVYNEPIIFLEQPVNTCSVPVGATMAFSALAQGEGLTYQWQYKQSASGGWMNSTASSASTPYFYYIAANYHNGYQYRCKVTDANGNTAISQIGTVAITTSTAPAVLITGDPADQTGRLGSTVTFAVAARGEGLTYQWQFKREGIEWGASSMTGSRTASISVGVTEARNGYWYRCVVTDGSGNTATSEHATLTVGEKIGVNADVILSVSGVTSETGFATYLADQHTAGTPVTVAYRLAQPADYEMESAKTIKLQSGVNTIYAIGGLSLDVTTMKGNFAVKMADALSNIRLKETAMYTYGTELPENGTTGELFFLLS